MTRFDRVGSKGRAGDLDADSGPETAQSRNMPVTQLRALRNVMRSGTSLPGGAQVTSTEGKPDEVMGALDQLSKNLLAGNLGSPPRWEETNAGARINSLLSRSNFSDDLIQITHTETRGINMNWTGSVTLRIVNPMLVSEGTGEFTASGGGGSTNSSGSSTTNTDSGEISGNAGGDKGGGSAKAGTSTGTTTSRGNAEASGSTTGAKTNDQLKRYRATIEASIVLRVEPDFSGSDYVNPLKWSMLQNETISEAVHGPREAKTSRYAGLVEYQVSAGIAKPPAAGGK